MYLAGHAADVNCRRGLLLGGEGQQNVDSVNNLGKAGSGVNMFIA